MASNICMSIQTISYFAVSLPDLLIWGEQS